MKPLFPSFATFEAINIDWMQLTPYHAKYFAYELTKRYSSNSLQKFTASLADAQVDLNPHQVEAALFAFKSPLSKGAILADEVGLGKTIEAGILLSQKWAERKRKILIITPANLRKQWSQEISEKFFLPSLILETKSFNEELKTGNFNPFEQKEKIVICSFQFAKTKDIYVQRTNWDLIVIDEAHRLRNVYKPTNKIGNAIKLALLDKPKILLTATPLQNSLLELYGLVSIIDDYAFGDVKSFKTQYARLTTEGNFDELKKRLEPLCKRTLRRQVLKWVNYTNRICITEPFTPNPDETKLYNLVSEYLQRTNLYALPPSQRQLMTLILRKLLASSTFAISGTLQALADKLGGVIQKQDTPVLPLEEIIIPNYEHFEEEKDEWEDEEDETISIEERIYTPEEVEEIKSEIQALTEFKELAKSILVNSKGNVLFTALEKGFEKLKELGANEKAIIFTESTRTQEYLRKILEEGAYKGKVVLFNGSNNDPKSNSIYKEWQVKYKGTDRITGSRTSDKRAAIVDYFREEATIMIATEAAAEGINLQFCSLVVNYDLPWNPQRIEQRIGRCHRYGQKFDVVVVNFLNTENAADQRVYQLLSEKFMLFEGVFGASDEVLGSVESGIDFEKRILKIFQTCRTPEEIQFAFDQLQIDMEGGMEAQLDITRKTLLENFDEEVNEKLRISLDQSREYLNRYENWLWNLSKYFLEPYATFNHSENSFFLNSNPFPDIDIHSGPYKIGKKHIGELKENEKQQDRVSSPSEQLLEFANIYRAGHPLAQKIITKCKTAELGIQELVFDYTNSGKIISILESLKGKSGWLQTKELSISTFEVEDHILFAATDDNGNILDAEECQRLFSIPAQVANLSDGATISPETQSVFNQMFYRQKVENIAQNETRNHSFFDEEVDKLEKWADDMINSLRSNLMEITKEIKSRKTEARKLLNLAQKVAEQRIIKDLEKKRSDLQLNLYQSENDVYNRKEELLNETEKKLKQNTSEEILFTIRWKVV
ncbi:MAG TPA: SNF2-related protein [Bacteroidia bacterium]|nr:SNF2-related protein [Bacteroidia bacterium]